MNLLTLDETAARFHVSVATMRSSAFRAKLVAAGLRTLRVGRRGKAKVTAWDKATVVRP